MLAKTSATLSACRSVRAAAERVVSRAARGPELPERVSAQVQRRTYVSVY